jgi:uncharacterized membrane protein
MTYTHIAYLHLATVLPAFLLGTYLMVSRKGSRSHRQLGKVYMVLMLFTAAVSLLLPAVVGPRFLGHFGFIHIFSLSVFFSVPYALYAARTHNRTAHMSSMIGLYVGGLLIAGGFAVLPGRMLHTILFT